MVAQTEVTGAGPCLVTGRPPARSLSSPTTCNRSSTISTDTSREFTLQTITRCHPADTDFICDSCASRLGDSTLTRSSAHRLAWQMSDRVGLQAIGEEECVFLPVLVSATYERPARLYVSVFTHTALGIFFLSLSRSFISFIIFFFFFFFFLIVFFNGLKCNTI